jgi:hypothetical protein
MPRGGKAKTALRERIAKLLRAGETQSSIARKLDKANSTIAYHCRLLGIEPKKYFRPLPLVNGKRRCDTCGRLKTADSFIDGSTATCLTCLRKKYAKARG